MTASLKDYFQTKNMLPNPGSGNPEKESLGPFVYGFQEDNISTKNRRAAPYCRNCAQVESSYDGYIDK
jgi:hypothetical protein